MNMQKKFLILFILVLALSAGLRFWKLGNIPNGIYWDEIAMLVDAKTVAENGRDMHGNSAFQTMFPSYGDYKLPVYIWTAAASVKLLGVSAFALRVPSSLLGVAQSILIFYLLKEITRQNKDKKATKVVSLIGALIVAVSPWSLLFSRTAFEGHLGQFFITLAVYGLFLSKRSQKYLIFSIITGAIAAYCYYSVRFVWPVLTVCFWLTQKIDFKFSGFSKLSSLKKWMIQSFLSGWPFVGSLVIWGVLLIPLFTSPYYRPSQQFRLSTDSLLTIAPYIQKSNEYRLLAGNTIFSRVFYHYRILQLRDLAKNYSNHFDLSYLFISGDPNLRHSTGQHGLFLLWTLPFLVSGLGYLLVKDKRVLFFLTIWWLIALLPASVPLNTPHALRSLNALSPIIILMAFGSLYFYNTIQNLRPKSIQFAFLVVFIFLASMETFGFFTDYFVIYPKVSADGWQQGYQQIVEAINKDYDRSDSVWANIEDDRFYLWYLAYGPLSASEIQRQSYENYFLHKIGKVEFRPFMWKGFENTVKPLIIVSRAGQLEQSPDNETIIFNSFGKPKFEIGVYEKK